MISLPRELLAEIKSAVEVGDYANTGDVVRDALRHWRRSRGVRAHDYEALRQLVAEGRASGAPLDGDVALMRLRAKYAAMRPEDNR